MPKTAAERQRAYRIRRRIELTQLRQAVFASDSPHLIDHVLAKLSPADRALLETAVRDEVRTATDDERARLMERTAEVEREREQVKAMARGITAVMTEDEYRLIRGLLHPDRHQDDAERYGRAFEAFKRLEGAINPNIPIKVLREQGWDKPRRRCG